MPQVIELGHDDWFLLGQIKQCKDYYRSLPYAEQERFKITERKEKAMFREIVVTSSREISLDS